VKRAFENARLQLASNPGERFALENGFNDVRAAELEAVLAEDRPVVVSFGGILTGRSEANWQVGGFNLIITEGTEIIGDPQPGFYVAVIAENRNGSLEALELRAEEFEIVGVLSQNGSAWTIETVSFSVGPETMITGQLAPGVTAAARIRILHTGDRVAVSIVTVARTAVPAQAPTGTAAPAPTARPTNTARPSPTPAPTNPPPTPVPTLAPTLAPAFTLPAGDDNENGNANEGGDDDDDGDDNSNGNSNSGSGSGDDGGDDDGGDDNSGSGGGGDSGSGSGDDGGDGGDDNSGSGGGDSSGSGGDDGDDHSGSGGGGGGDEDDD
jgi:hypothetical protein